MPTTSSLHIDYDHVTKQLERVSSGFFCELPKSFLRSSTTKSMTKAKRDLMQKWLAIAKHPEPELALIVTYSTNRRASSRAFRAWSENLKQMGFKDFSVWRDPKNWSELCAWVRNNGFEPFPTFVELGSDLKTFALSENRIAFVPSWQDGGAQMLERIKFCLSMKGRRRL